MLTQKTKCLLAYCHTILVDAEELTVQGKGISIVKSSESRQNMRMQGATMVLYCESVGATREHLGSLRGALLVQAQHYYGLIIRDYQKHISTVGGRHVPILFATIMFQTFQDAGMLKLDINYKILMNDIERSDMLETNDIISRISGKTVLEKTEVKKYYIGVKHIIDNVMSAKVKFKRKKG